MEMIGRQTTPKELTNNGWVEKEPFGEYRKFKKSCTEIGWNPTTKTVELQRKTP